MELRDYLVRALEKWGEIVIRTASGQTWEVHAGDEPIFEPFGIAFRTPDAEHLILYEHIERVTTHRANGADA